MKTCPCLTARLLIGRKEPNQTEPSHRGDFLVYPHHVFCLAMFTQTFDLVLNRTVSSRRLSCVPSTCVLPCQVTFYYCLGDQYFGLSYD